MADSDIAKLSVEEQVARIKAAKEAAKKAAADKLAASAVAAAVAPVAVAVPAPAAPVAPVAPAAPVAVVATSAPAAVVAAPASVAAPAQPAAPAPAPGSVEEKVAQIKAAKAAAALKSHGGTASIAKPAAPVSAPVAGTTTAAPAPGSVEEKVAQIKAAKAAAAAKTAAGTGVVAAPAAVAAASATPYTEPGTPAAIARAAAVHEKALGATGINAHGTPANRPAVELLAAAAKPGVAKTPPKKEEKQTGPLPPPPQMAPRRAFLGFITLGTFTWLAFFSWFGIQMYQFLRFMFPNVLYESDPKFNAGRKNDYPEAPKVYERFKQDQAVWIVRLTEDGEDRLVALSTVCTHLGCTPNWLETEQKYKCPCHGSGYYLNGVNFEGPTPRPLERFRIFVDGSGNIIVDKAKKYRQDLQQWNENQSFLLMG